MSYLFTLLLLSLLSKVHSLNATLTVYQTKEALLNLSFSQPIHYPSFQIFNAVTKISFTVLNSSKNSYFMLKPHDISQVLLEPVFLVFSDPFAVGNGDLDLSSFIIETTATTEGITIPEPLVIVTSFILVVTIAYGRSGLMLVTFIQTFILVSKYSVFFKVSQDYMKSIFFMNWYPGKVSGVSPQMFLNTSIEMILICTFLVTVSLIARFTLRDITNDWMLRVKSVFNYNILILCFEVMFIPICVNIFSNFSAAASLGSAQQLTAIVIVNHIVCTLFLCLILGYIGFCFWFMNSTRINKKDPQIFRATHKMFSGLSLNKWYTRNFHVLKLCTYFLIGLTTLVPNPVYLVAVIQAIIIFIVFTTTPYVRNSYCYFAIALESAALLDYIFVSVEALFNRISPMILGYKGTLTLNALTGTVFFIIILFSVAFSVYEAYSITRSFIYQRKAKAEEEKELMFELMSPEKNKSVSRTMSGGLGTPSVRRFPSESPVRVKQV